MRLWGAGRPVSMQGDRISLFTTQPNCVIPPLEVLADQLPSTASYEGVLGEHEDIGSLL